MTAQVSFLARARKKSNLTPVDIASATGKKTPITVQNWEADPDSIKYGDLKGFYHALDDGGKAVMREGIANAFDM